LGKSASLLTHPSSMTRKGTRVNRGLLISSTVLSTMNITIKTMSYSQRKDRDILQSCLKTWFRNPKDLHFNGPTNDLPLWFSSMVLIVLSRRSYRYFCCSGSKMDRCLFKHPMESRM